jgi:hypothetical protein
MATSAIRCDHAGRAGTAPGTHMRAVAAAIIIPLHAAAGGRGGRIAQPVWGQAVWAAASCICKHVAHTYQECSVKRSRDHTITTKLSHNQH